MTGDPPSGLDRGRNESSPHLLVLAGGFGTRLRSVTGDLPKPLVPVEGRPFIDYLIDGWLEQGVGEMTFMLHHGAELLKSHLSERRRAGRMGGCKVNSVVESVPLGTGGAVAHAVRTLALEGPFLVANADTWLGSGVGPVWAGRSPSIGVVQVEEASRYGRVRLEAGRVVSFEEKGEGAGGGLINAGLYRLDAASFSAWDGGAFSLETGLFPALVEERRLAAVTLRTDFIDIGVPEYYSRFCRWIQRGRRGSP